MFRVLFNSEIGTTTHSSQLADAVLDPGDYGHVPTSGLLSGHQGCTGCGMVSGTNQVLRALKLTGRFVAASIGTGCNEVITTQNTSCWGEVSVDHNNFPNTAATLSGNRAAYEALVRSGRIPADSVVNVAIAGDGGSYDIGLQALLAWIARNEDGVYVCLNNEAYMNTGIQSSGATPFGAKTSTTPYGKAAHGNSRTPQHLPDLALAGGAPYVAVATPVHHRDLMIKAQKAALISGPCLLESYSVCPPGWNSESDFFYEITELALATRVLVLYEAELHREEGYAIYTLSHVPDRWLPVEEYLKTQGRFQKLLRHPELVERVQAMADRRWEFWSEVLTHNGLPVHREEAGVESKPVTRPAAKPAVEPISASKEATA
ncbi:MAG: pyruvate ferredoxin oxidoreductase [Acidobacteria bacterium]|nr:pyruvate ferredoxin oxidoreductase [Acidobacteriota bacterium]